MAGRRRRPWGSVTPKHTAKRKRFYAEYTGPDGARHTAGRSFETAQDADSWLVAERRLIERDDWTPPAERRRRERHAGMTVGEWLDTYHDRLQDTDRIRASTAQAYRRVVKSRITGTKLAEMPLVRVQMGDVQAWWAQTTRDYPKTPTTNRNAYKRLRAAFQALVDDESSPLTDNPVKVVEASKRPRPKFKELPEREELEAIIEKLPERYKLAGVLCLLHGLRVGEVLALRRKHVVVRDRDGWPEVDIRVRGNVQRIADAEGHMRMVWQDAKTAAGVRDVPVFPELAPVVVDHLERFAGKGAEGLVTPTESGEVVFDTSFRSIFNRARRAAGVRDDLTPHYGRNYLITLLAERGATPAEIGSILGQEDLKTIVETYMRVRPSRPRDLMGRLG